MRAVVQRVTRASCEVEGAVTGQIGAGLVVLLGVAPSRHARHRPRPRGQLVKLRIFNDEAGKMNRSLSDIGGAVLSISQFTLFADTSRGNRPSFLGAAPPEQGRALYAEFNAALRALGVVVGEGVFGAHMVVSLVNDGPVTLTLGSHLTRPMLSGARPICFPHLAPLNSHDEGHPACSGTLALAAGPGRRVHRPEGRHALQPGARQQPQGRGPAPPEQPQLRRPGGGSGAAPERQRGPAPGGESSHPNPVKPETRFPRSLRPRPLQPNCRPRPPASR